MNYHEEDSFSSQKSIIENATTDKKDFDNIKEILCSPLVYNKSNLNHINNPNLQNKNEDHNDFNK